VGIVMIVEQRPVTGRTLSISGRMTIGRESCDIVLPDPEVSRRHAAITAGESPATIEDLGSTNGTFVNGDRVQVAEVHDGDVLRFGQTVWHVVAPSDAGGGAAATRVATG
jgi:pSer/pThr/pTyr-binding forkhead associated (FHA) protein